MNETDFFRPIEQIVLADDWGTLTKHTFSLKRRDGAWQQQTREAYDRGNGAACLLYNREQGTVLLVKQFRLPAKLNGHQGFLIETPAGLLEGMNPAERMRAELEEETGFSVSKLTLVFDAFMSPGSVTEKLACFVGTYTAKDQISEGGGHPDEGEDIEVLHVPLNEALAMIASGAIADAKTIMLLQYLALNRNTL
ncbi:NUDIX domain-containing protein [Ahrensia marina]|uniref:NUDIX domain-containing protein n=1 Tax=Ahrensia marina TaxID=1514904 RepID=UPI0035D0E30E